jgi:hypothetical protein
VIETHFKMKPEEFDTKFLAWLDGQVKETGRELRGLAQAHEVASRGRE